MRHKNTRADRLIRITLSQEPMVDWSFAAQAGEILANEGYEFSMTNADGIHVFENMRSGMKVIIQDDMEGGFKWSFSNGTRGVSVETLETALKKEDVQSEVNINV